MHQRFSRWVGASLIAMMMSSLATSTSSAQRRASGASAEPDYWVGLSVGFVDAMSMSDNASGSSWNIGSSSQIRATLEKRLQGANIGFAAGFGNADLTYYSGNAFEPACGAACQAKVDITQYLVYVTNSGGFGGIRGATTGFRGFYELEGGITQFSHFKEQVTETQLPPTNASSDFTFGVGGGISYFFSNSAQLYAGTDYQFILHKQLTNTTNAAPREYGFRLGFKAGF